MNRTARAALASLAAFLVACDGSSRVAGPILELPAGTEAVATLRGTVDLVAGTMTFERVVPPASALRGASGVSASVYGDQGITVRIYNSPVVVTNPSAPGKKRYSANVGLRNLQAFPIGDEQGGLAPFDTTGIFVFMNGGPTATRTSSPCSPACSVTVANAHGRMAFNAPDQAYWYWKDRLMAAGGLRDTTLERMSWSFEADTQVTSFSFDVLVAAAWPSPYESRWKIEFSGDSLPHLASEPRWLRDALLATDLVQLDPSSPGGVLLTSPPNGSQTFERRDSVGTSSDAYMEARIRLNSAPSKPEVSFGFFDGSRFIGVGLSGTRVGWAEPGFNGTGMSVASATTTFQTYRLRKFGSDSVQVLVNGTRVLSRAYSAFTLTSAVPYSYFEFGNPGPVNRQRSQSGNSSTWDYVIYEIGVTQP